MYVLVDRPRLLSDLQAFLRGRGFIAAQRRGDCLDVSIPGDSDTAQARRVVSVYLTVWQAVHPGVQASIVDNDRTTNILVSVVGLPPDRAYSPAPAGPTSSHFAAGKAAEDGGSAEERQAVEQESDRRLAHARQTGGTTIFFRLCSYRGQARGRTP